jgi:hypothetical protein
MHHGSQDFVPAPGSNSNIGLFRTKEKPTSMPAASKYITGTPLWKTVSWRVGPPAAGGELLWLMSDEKASALSSSAHAQ